MSDEESPSDSLAVVLLPEQPDLPGEDGRWKRFWRGLMPVLFSTRGYGEDYVKAKVQQEQHTASRMSSESVRAFNAAVDDVFSDPSLPDAARMLKLAKLVEEFPEVVGQIATVKRLLMEVDDAGGTISSAQTSHISPRERGLPGSGGVDGDDE